MLLYTVRKDAPKSGGRKREYFTFFLWLVV